MKNNEKILIGISSKKNEIELSEKIKQLKITCGNNCEVFIYQNTTGIGLAKVYNEIVNKFKNEYNRFVFMHDDIDVITYNWGYELNKIFNEHPEYGIIGLAGSETLLGDGRWWNKSNRTYGRVIHFTKGKKFCTSFHPSKFDVQEIAVIDGLFIAFDITRVENKFDEEFDGFHFYDITFSLDNFLSKKSKNGVTTNIRVIHHSTGDSNNQEWINNRNKMLKKYKTVLPIINLQYEIKDL